MSMHSEVAAQLVLRRRKAVPRVQVTQLGARTKFGGARRRGRAVSGVTGWVLAIYRPAIAAFLAASPAPKSGRINARTQEIVRG